MSVDSLIARGGFAPCFPVAVARALGATGVEGTGEPYDTPYGREVVHVEPDHNLLRFVMSS